MSDTDGGLADLREVVTLLTSSVGELVAEFRAYRVRGRVLMGVVVAVVVLFAALTGFVIYAHHDTKSQVRDLACAIIAGSPDTVPAVAYYRSYYNCPPYSPKAARSYASPTPTPTPSKAPTKAPSKRAVGRSVIVTPVKPTPGIQVTVKPAPRATVTVHPAPRTVTKPAPKPTPTPTPKPTPSPSPSSICQLVHVPIVCPEEGL